MNQYTRSGGNGVIRNINNNNNNNKRNNDDEWDVNENWF